MQKEKKQSKNNEEPQEGVELCDKCGSKLAEEDGVNFCPNCDSQIDFFGEDDE